MEIPLSRALRQFVSLAASSEDPVLILGETGTGKTLLARLIHDCSARSAGPCVVVNCASLPDGLIDRELFGHLAGSFTDARSSAPGLFESANNGSIVLDEVAELAPVAQAKLLTVLESRVVRRIGSTTETPVDVRIIAATNADLESEVSVGRFRADLFYRLAGLRTTVPPLRRRLSELPRLTAYLLTQHRHGRTTSIDAEAIEVLRRHRWPGNVRELDHVLRNVRARTDGRITADDVAKVLPLATGRIQRRQQKRSGTSAGKTAVLDALKQSGWNKSQAARRLGMSRSSLWMKMRILGIEPSMKETPTPSARRLQILFHVDRFRADLVAGWRFLVGRPISSIFLMIVTTVGIALVTAVFALGDPFLLRPLPYRQPDDLVVIKVDQGPRQTGTAAGILDLSTITSRLELFEDVAAYQKAMTVRLQMGGATGLLRVAQATPNLFALLEASEMRTWRLALPDSNGLLPLVLTHQAFKQLQWVPGPLVGQVFSVDDGRRVQVVGVLPEGFVLPTEMVLWPPEAFVLTQDQLSVSSSFVIGRLRQGVTAKKAALALQVRPESVTTPVEVQSLHAALTRHVRAAALGGAAAAALILLVCAGNVGNLMLGRTVFRAREFALREALGASGAAVFRQIAVESGLLLALSWIAALCLAAGLLVACARILPLEYQSLGQPSVTMRAASVGAIAAGFLWLAAVAAAVVAWRRMAASVHQTRPQGRAIRKVRFALTVVQSALATTLLVGAVLLVRSYVALVTRDTGYESGLTIAKVSYPASRAGAALQEDIDRTLDEIHRVPGVEGVAAARGAFVDRRLEFGFIVIDGRPETVHTKFVSPGYFAVVGSRLVEGRTFVARDRRSNVLIVNETLARRLVRSGGSDARSTGPTRNSVVIGVVADTLDHALDQSIEPLAFRLLEDPPGCERCENPINFVIRTRDRSDLAGFIHRAVRRVNSNAVVMDVSGLSSRYAASIAQRTFATLVLNAFAVTALVVAIAGLIGVVGFVVARRLREVAVRAALGASSASLVWLVISEVLISATTGIGIGVAAGWLGSSLISHLLYNIPPGEPVTTLVTGILMLAVAVVGALLAARRVWTLSPARLLNVE